MTTRTLSRAAVAAILALAASAPAAMATPPVPDEGQTVCNQATPHSLGGDLATLPGDPLPPARYTTELKAHPGQGEGLVNAASKSHALQVCDTGDDDGGDDDGGITIVIT